MDLQVELQCVRKNYYIYNLKKITNEKLGN